jgi:hypothetical protein
MLSAALAFGASFLPWNLLRIAATAVAIVLFLFVAYEVSCDLLEPDKGPCDPQGHSAVVVPVTPLQIFFAGALAILYTFLICSALHGLVSTLAFQATWTEIVVIPAVFFIACKAAWRNVRLWSYQSVEYVELLQENRNQLDEIERLKKLKS